MLPCSHLCGTLGIARGPIPLRMGKMSDEPEVAPTRPTIWGALYAWADELEIWQAAILAFAVKFRRLSNPQIGEVYSNFLSHCGLLDAESPRPSEFPHVEVPASEEATEVVKLVRVDSIRGVNALPSDSALTFGPNLTVIYGRNGAGKSGFARVLADACFSRSEIDILPNVYADTPVRTEASAMFHIQVDGKELDAINYPNSLHLSKLRHIAAFDSD